MRLYDKADLAKLKDSKPVPIIAHSHEVIVPVVYSGMVNRFLEHKGVHLPLTHHQLADMKREADCPGYAKGTKDLKKKKKRAKKTKKAKPNVIAPVGLGIAPAPSRAQMLYSNLRPDNYATIRPMVQPGYVQPPQIPDYKREAEEKMKLEKKALELYLQETEQRINHMKNLEQQELELAKQQAPLRMDDRQIPVRHAHGFSTDSWDSDAYRNDFSDEEERAMYAGYIDEHMRERQEKRAERRAKQEKSVSSQSKSDSEQSVASSASSEHPKHIVTHLYNKEGTQTGIVFPAPAKPKRGRPKKGLGF